VDHLMGLLAIDDAAFFMKYEVLLAENLDEFCDFASGSPPPQATSAMQAFAEIRRVGESKSLGAFVAHPSTQQRLGQVVTQFAGNASARLLALQGSGNRPRFLERRLLVIELRKALEPPAYLEKREV